MATPTYIITAYDPTHERWRTAGTHDIDDATHAAQQLAERFGWVDVWRAYPDLVVHYDRVHAATPRTPRRRYLDRVTSSLSLATSRWYAAVATGDAGLADAAWYVYSRVLEGAAGAAEMEAA